MMLHSGLGTYVYDLLFIETVHNNIIDVRWVEWADCPQDLHSACEVAVVDEKF